MTISYLALGSNLNCPLRQMKFALESINQVPKTNIFQKSGLYLTTPSHARGQPLYLNMVVGINTKLSVHQLLNYCQIIEQEQKRVRKKKNQARTIDIDILLFGDLNIKNKNIIIPHPRMFHRDFVLAPLQDLQPDLKIFKNFNFSEALLKAEKCIIKKIQDQI